MTTDSDIPKGDWKPVSRYPDPRVMSLDPRFDKLKLPLAGVERLATGCRWNEGPVWFGDARCLLWSDIPNNRVRGLCPPTANPPILPMGRPVIAPGD